MQRQESQRSLSQLTPLPCGPSASIARTGRARVALGAWTPERCTGARKGGWAAGRAPSGGSFPHKRGRLGPCRVPAQPTEAPTWYLQHVFVGGLHHGRAAATPDRPQGEVCVFLLNGQVARGQQGRPRMPSQVQRLLFSSARPRERPHPIQLDSGPEERELRGRGLCRGREVRPRSLWRRGSRWFFGQGQVFVFHVRSLIHAALTPVCAIFPNIV